MQETRGEQVFFEHINMHASMFALNQRGNFFHSEHDVRTKQDGESELTTVVSVITDGIIQGGV